MGENELQSQIYYINSDGSYSPIGNMPKAYIGIDLAKEESDETVVSNRSFSFSLESCQFNLDAVSKLFGFSEADAILYTIPKDYNNRRKVKRRKICEIRCWALERKGKGQ